MLEIDTRLLTEAERFHEVMHGVDPHVIGQHVVIGIAGMHDGFIHIDHAVTTGLIVFKGMVTESEIAGISDGLIRCTLT